MIKVVGVYLNRCSRCNEQKKLSGQKHWIMFDIFVNMQCFAEKIIDACLYMLSAFVETSVTFAEMTRQWFDGLRQENSGSLHKWSKSIT